MWERRVYFLRRVEISFVAIEERRVYFLRRVEISFVAIETAHALVLKKEKAECKKLKNELEEARRHMHWSIRKKAKDEYYGKLILDLGNKVCSSVEQGTTAMEKLVEKLGNVKDKAECKKLKKELEEARFNNTFLRMQNERVKRDPYWTRVRVHEFYQEMIHRGFVFEERLNEAIDVSIKDEKSPSSEPRGSPLSRISAIGCNDLYHLMTQCNYVLTLLIIPPKSAPLTQAAIHRMIKESVDAAIAAERARHANAGNDARGVEQGMTAMEKLVEKLGNVKDKAECKKLKKELKEA
nr:hypothetical protein [Tanacetum cinerariifolium]